MALSWRGMAERIGVTWDEMCLLRDDARAPKERNIKAWLTFAGLANGSVLPGDNLYDESVTAGSISYAEALVREKVNEQTIVNEGRELDLSVKRGKFVPVKEAEEKLLEHQVIFLAAVAQVLKAASKDFIPGDRPRVNKLAKKWTNAVKAAVSEKLGS